ncbi:NAD(P)H-binding protein [Kutzneria chonburiensis]|uniref:NAD(P)H-binding protein n=1 Tax=Kutzneria chonburiensis TaxID=1483604 RepID=A0ABV6N875_9PSEU|nr:NAD(P)H-binding protein [Kutzneria chonburiensis]
MAILVTGAAGNIGRHIVSNALEAGTSVRALVRRPAEAQLPADVDVVPGDMTDLDAVRRALDGVEALYLFPVLDVVPAIAQLAREAGLRTVVFLSGAWTAGLSLRDRESWTYAQYVEAEAAVEAAGLEWTMLRPGPFMTNMLWWSRSIKSERVVHAPYAAATCPAIHEADIADVATAALLEPGHAGARYMLTGPAQVSQIEQSQALSAALGEEITFDELTADQWRDSVGRFLRPGIAADLLRDWSETAADPASALPVHDTVQRVTDKPARTIGQWAQEHLDAFQ